MGLFKSVKKTVSKGWNDLTGASQAKNAANQKSAYTNQALGEYDQFTDPRYQQAQRDIIDRMGAGTAANIDENAFTQNMVNPMMDQQQRVEDPGIRQSFRNNFWSTNRTNAQQGSINSLMDRIAQARQNAQQQAGAREETALQTLQNAGANRANIYQGAAAGVQAMPSALQQLSDTAAGIKNVRGAYAAVAPLPKPTSSGIRV